MGKPPECLAGGGVREKPPGDTQSSFARYLHHLVMVSVVVVSALTCAGYCGGIWWVAGLMDHFRVQYILVLAICAPLLIQRHHSRGIVVLLPLMLNLGDIAPLYIRSEQPAPASTIAISIAHYNMDRSIKNHDEALSYLEETGPDLLSLQEVTPSLEEQLPVNLPGYETVLSHPLDNTHGSMLMLRKGSLLELVSTEIIHLPGRSERPLIMAVFKSRGREFVLLSLHVTRPRNQGTARFQQIEFAAVAEWSETQHALGRSVFIIGDFNAASWTDGVQSLMKKGMLMTSEAGYGIQPTWPAYMPWPLAIPIDHCLHSADIIIRDRRTGPYLGGDHAPLLVSFAMAERGAG